MYGPSDGEIARFIIVVALIGGLVFLGAEHGCGYVAHHARIEWR